MATVLVLTGCDNLFVSPTERTIAQSEAEGTPVSSIPFTSKSVLDRLNSSDETIVPWKLARTLTYIEFRGHIAEEHGWTHTTLSEYPVVIYDAQSRPQYYEFIVQNPSGEAVGTITAHGRKVSTAIVSHILPFVRDYEFLQTKGDSYAQIASIYPRSVLIGIPGKSGDDITLMLNPVTGEADTPVEFGTEEETIAELRAMSPEKLQQVAEISHAELEQQIIQGYAERQQRETQVTEYWSHFSPVPQEALTISDEEIDQRFVETKRDRNVRSVPYERIIASTNMRKTSWQGWCVPSSVAWAYRLFYNRYKGTYLPIHGNRNFALLNEEGTEWLRVVSNGRYSYYNYGGESNLNEIKSLSNARDGGLYYELARVGHLSSGLFEGFVSPTYLNEMVRAITNGANGAPIQLLARGRLYNQIYNRGKPVFFAGVMDTGSVKKGHQIVLMGAKRVVKTGETQFLFWWIPWETIYPAYYMVHDNGAVTGTSSALGGSSKGNNLPFWVSESGLYNNTLFPIVSFWN